MVITIDELLKGPFAKRTLDDQIQIVLEGKPRPELDMSAITVGDDGMISTQTFEVSMYDQVPWLTGSEKQQSFFCWPCLLFVSDPVWKVSDLVLLSEGMTRHEKTTEHIQAALTLKDFVSKHVNVLKLTLDEHQFNEMVQKNRDVLKFLIDTVCNIIARSQPPRKRSEPQSQIKPELCVKVLKLQRNYVGHRKNHIDDAIKLINAAPILLNNLVDAITRVVRTTVKKEVQKSTFASLILSEHSIDPTKSQISTVLRYIEKGKVCERFLGFSNILVSKSADIIYSFIKDLIQEFEISEKLLSHSFDGAILNSHELSDVIELMERNHPHSYFVPCYFHKLYYIFQQSLSTFKRCAKFMTGVSAMGNYFVKTSKQWRAFETFMLGSIPTLKYSKWSINVPFIKVVNSCRKNFIEFFDSVIKNCTKWSANDITLAYGFQQFLGQFHTIFLLQVFSSIIEITSRLDDALKSNALENTFGSSIVSDTIKNLSTYKEKKFESIWKATIEENGAHQNQESKKIKTDVGEEKDLNRKLYSDIIDCLKQEISFRFKSLDKLEFCGLLNKENGVYSIESSDLKAFFNYYLTQMEQQNLEFDLDRLQNEVIVLRTNSDMFANKDLYSLLEHLTDLKSSFKFVSKLVEFILTMPSKPPSLCVSSSKFENIKKFHYSVESTTVTGDISVLHIELDHLQDIQKNIFFHDEVISKFFEIDKSVELMLQKS